MLNVGGRAALVVGGGPVAARRAAALAEAGAWVRVVAREVGEAAREVAGRYERIAVSARAFEPGDCEGAFVVVAATDDAGVNEFVASSARAAGALVNRADEPEAGDFAAPAHRRLGPITVSVSTGGAGAAAGRELVEQLISTIDVDRATLLAIAGEYRPIARRRIADAGLRRAALRAMTDESALSALKAGGEGALRAHLEEIIDRAE